jgi:hypothetical protein
LAPSWCQRPLLAPSFGTVVWCSRTTILLVLNHNFMQLNYIELVSFPNWNFGLTLATPSCRMESNVFYSLNSAKKYLTTFWLGVVFHWFFLL